jgi:uncharacterized protein (UPF0276 family)
MAGFTERLSGLPFLGLGVSTEYGAQDAEGSLDLEALHTRAPLLVEFLEVGVEASKGLDPHARAWAAAGRATTYHFLDINLDEREDLDAPWVERVTELAGLLSPAWVCGDAGLWHFGPRDPAHMLLLPPILTDDSASEMADGIVRLRDALGFEVLPENPPGSVFIGDLHILDFYARVCDRADTGMLLDCAHLAIHQQLTGRDPLDGLDGFPLDRIVEIHVAGGDAREHEGFPFVVDDHGPEVLPDTWTILDSVAPRAAELRAVVFECERNPLPRVVAGLNDLSRRLLDTPFGRRRA